MTKNSGKKPHTGTAGQSQKCEHGKGGYNKPGTPFGQPAASSNKPVTPQHGTAGQRLAGGAGGGKATGYPPGYTSR